MTRNVPENDGPRESGPNWAEMRPEDFDEAAPLSLFDAPAAPVTGGLFDLLDDGQGDDEAAVPVDEPLFGRAADRVRELLAAAGEDYRRAEAARRAQDRRDDAGLRAPAGGDAVPTGAVRELLAAVVAAVDLPLPGVDERDERAYGRLLASRAHDVVVAVAGVLDEGHRADGAARWLRDRVAETPAAYVAWDGQGGGAR